MNFSDSKSPLPSCCLVLAFRSALSVSSVERAFLFFFFFLRTGTLSFDNCWRVLFSQSCQVSLKEVKRSNKGRCESDFKTFKKSLWFSNLFQIKDLLLTIPWLNASTFGMLLCNDTPFFSAHVCECKSARVPSCPVLSFPFFFSFQPCLRMLKFYQRPKTYLFKELNLS